LADKMEGDDKARRLEIANAWLKLADEAAKTALKDRNDLSPGNHDQTKTKTDPIAGGTASRPPRQR
jgi:hypothetical protein